MADIVWRFFVSLAVLYKDCGIKVAVFDKFLDAPP